MFCPLCGKPAPADAVSCPNCGRFLPFAGRRRSRLTLLLLAGFLGILGLHRFYAGRSVSAGCMLALSLLGIISSSFITGALFWVPVCVWTLIDFSMALLGRFKDGDGNYIKDREDCSRSPAFHRCRPPRGSGTLFRRFAGGSRETRLAEETCDLPRGFIGPSYDSQAVRGCTAPDADAAGFRRLPRTQGENMYCIHCGKSIPDDADTCPECGRALPVMAATHGSQDDVSPKSRLALTLLAFFLGPLGIHRFYAGRILSGVIMLLLFLLGLLSLLIVVGILPIGLASVWSTIDLILAICGLFRDGDGRYITVWLDENPHRPAGDTVRVAHERQHATADAHGAGSSPPSGKE